MKVLVLRRNVIALCVLAGSCFALASGAEARTVRVGVILSLSGAEADFGTRMKQGVEVALAERGNKVGQDTIEVIMRDDGDASLQRVRQLVQEMVVRDHVEIMAGLDTTPQVLAVAEVANQAKIPFIIFNAGTAGLTLKSPYFVRVGFTQWVTSNPFAKWVATQGKRRAVLAVADYAPGYSAADGFKTGFTEGGGTVLDTLKVPLNTTDTSSYLQKIEDLKPDCTFIFFPVGALAVNFVRSYLDKGLAKKGIDIYATSSEFDEVNLPSIGPAALGLVSSGIYGADLDNPENKRFVSALKKAYGPELLPHIFHVAAYDGMQVIFHMIEATAAAPDAEKAMNSIKGFAWKSPRGPVRIDPDNREIVQNVYIRRVVMDNGKMVDRAFEVLPAVGPQK